MGISSSPVPSTQTGSGTVRDFLASLLWEQDRNRWIPLIPRSRSCLETGMETDRDSPLSSSPPRGQKGVNGSSITELAARQAFGLGTECGQQKFLRESSPILMETLKTFTNKK